MLSEHRFHVRALGSGWDVHGQEESNAGLTVVEAVLCGTFTRAARTHTHAPVRTQTPGVEAERRVRPQASLWRDHPRRCPRTDLRVRGWLPRERPAIES